MELINYFQYNSFIILSYFFISFFVLALKYFTADISNRLIFSSYRSSLNNPLTYIRAFTHIFGHEDWKHFSGNFIYILLIGPMIEEKYGSLNLLVMILLTALIISFINFIVGKKRILGASGIVYMFIVLSSFVNTDLTKIPITLVLIFLFFVVNEIIDGLTKEDGISHSGHLIGAICGAVFGFMIIHGFSFEQIFIEMFFKG